MSELILYGAAESTYVRTARMACEEKGVPYTLDAFQSFGFRSDAHRQLHPFGQMPVMRHDDLVLFETLAICHYIDAAFEGPALVPEKLADRCRMLQWTSAVSDQVYHRLVRKWILPLLREKLDDDGRIAARRGAREALEVLDQMCGDQGFLLGDSPTLADLYLAPLLAYALRADDQILSGLTRLNRAWSGISNRESFVRTMP